MNKVYSPELAQFIIDNSNKLTNKQIAELAAKKFNRQLTLNQIQKWKQKRGIPSFRSFVGNKVYEQWELDLIAWFCPSMTDQELSDWFYLVWNTERTAASIKSVRSKYKINNGRKGHFPENESLKKWNYLFTRGAKPSSTRFKKGELPLNYKEKGTEVLNGEGYYEVKIDDKRGWQYRSRIVYEAAHGPIPKGMCVLHIDGDKTNDSLDNLVLVSKEERLQINARLKLIQGETDFNKACINLAKLTCQGAIYGKSVQEN